MNMRYGGNQRILRNTVITEGCLGPGEAKMYFKDGRWSTTWTEGATMVNLKPRVGQTQVRTFAPGSPPPFYDWDAPVVDKVVGKAKARTGKRKRGASAGAASGGAEDCEGEGMDGSSEREVDVVREEYVGKAKGIRQVLWERGKDPERNPATVLSKLPDFRDERSALEHTVESRGHILLLSPKYHPELAGVGIEYSWGMSKLKFRRVFNDESPASLHRNILQSMSMESILTLGRVRRFARRSRDYARAYRALEKEVARGDSVIDGKAVIEKMRKLCKAHRNIVDMEPGFLDGQ